MRLVYTEGCGSGSAWHFIDHHNAAAAVGHKSTSASPLFAFSIVRNWVYGRDLATSVHRGWESGKRKARTLNAVSFGKLADFGGWRDVEHMIESSEPMLSWTPEIPPKKMKISLSAVPVRERSAHRQIAEVEVSEVFKDIRGKFVAELDLRHDSEQRIAKMQE